MLSDVVICNIGSHRANSVRNFSSDSAASFELFKKVSKSRRHRVVSASEGIARYFCGPYVFRAAPSAFISIFKRDVISSNSVSQCFETSREKDNVSRMASIPPSRSRNSFNSVSNFSESWIGRFNALYVSGSSISRNATLASSEANASCSSCSRTSRSTLSAYKDAELAQSSGTIRANNELTSSLFDGSRKTSMSALDVGLTILAPNLGCNGLVTFSFASSCKRSNASYDGTLAIYTHSLSLTAFPSSTLIEFPKIFSAASTTSFGGFGAVGTRASFNADSKRSFDRVNKVIADPIVSSSFTSVSQTLTVASALNIAALINVVVAHILGTYRSCVTGAFGLPRKDDDSFSYTSSYKFAHAMANFAKTPLDFSLNFAASKTLSCACAKHNTTKIAAILPLKSASIRSIAVDVVASPLPPLLLMVSFTFFPSSHSPKN
mmetsp:Transcript_1659/g.5075  ORF Transcript_1659/g.5075 Transcript_1659/m.5075 type:complete len:436 (+) Transcript_1659:2091-3398(+)